MAGRTFRGDAGRTFREVCWQSVEGGCWREAVFKRCGGWLFFRGVGAGAQYLILLFL